MTRSTFVVPRLVVSIFVLFVLSSPVNAAVFCVDSASALQSALTSAQSNGEDDQIQIVQGTYVGNFVYASTQANDLACIAHSDGGFGWGARFVGSHRSTRQRHGDAG
jgi:hypothetical protein